jgi:hypothetical protein
MIRVLSCCCLLLAGVPARAEILARWVQYAPGNTVLLRAVVTDAGCPAATRNGAEVALLPRVGADADFPVTVCEASVPAAPADVTLGGVAMHMPVAAPKRILVLGDSGCRLQAPAYYQACNDPYDYPLARIAALAASLAPDLIIHVGDYFYRESACPPGGLIDCIGSPSGDNWASWKADWFAPARPLLAAAPMILARGNHEGCGRGAPGWFRLLDPYPFDPESVRCRRLSAFDTEAPYVVAAGGVNYLIFDSSNANDFARTSSAAMTDIFRKQLDGALQGLAAPVVFVTHKPAYGLIQVQNGVVSGGNHDEQALFGNGVPEAIRLLLSGHIHNFQAVQLADPRYAPQLVAGIGGTALDPDLVADPQRNVPYQITPDAVAPTVDTHDLAEFGVVVLDVVPGGYHVTTLDVNGLTRANCTIAFDRRQIACAP